MVLPLSEPIRGLDGTLMSEIPIAKDTVVLIGVLGSNLNSRTWGDDAWEWKPERWLSPLPESITEAGMPGVAGILYVRFQGCQTHMRTDAVYVG